MGSHLCYSAWGAVGGSVPFSGHLSRGIKVERALYIHSPHLQSMPARDSNLTIRLLIPPWAKLKLIIKIGINRFIWNVQWIDSNTFIETHLGTCCTVQLHNILEGRALYKTASLMNIDRVSCTFSRSHKGLINLECEIRNTFINV